MCYLTNQTLMEDIRKCVEDSVADGKCFTGYDIYCTLAPVANPMHVSSYVRELFNRHDPIFVGYACFPIPAGPLLYFPLAKTNDEVMDYAEKIAEEIAEKLEAESAGAESEEA